MKPHLAGLVIAPLAASCLLIGACSAPSRTKVNATLTRDDSRPDASLEKIVNDTYNSMFTLMAPLYLFYAQNERWPASGQELQHLTRELGLTFDLATYSQLDLRELDDGSLLVRFELAPPGQGGGEFVLSKPDFEEQPSPSRKLMI